MGWKNGRGGVLYRADGYWVYQDAMMTLQDEPPKAISDAAALEWLLMSGYAPPKELAELAETYRVR